MPDIALRFYKDMLVLSAPLATVLAHQGINMERDLEYLTLIEPEAMTDALRLESIAGAQCLVAGTEGITPARLTHGGMEKRLADLAQAACDIVHELKPHHVLAEIGPCGLPLDASSAASLNENRSQYARAARAFEGALLDAFLLGSFANLTDLKCALMGVRQVSDAPVFATIDVDGEGLVADGRATLEEAVALMNEFGASVAGITTGAPIEQAVVLVKCVCAATDLPVLVQLRVAEHAPRQGAATPENPYYCPDAMVDAAEHLRAAGAQFLRAVGDITPAYTGALATATEGLDVVTSQATSSTEDEPDLATLLSASWKR